MEKYSAGFIIIVVFLLVFSSCNSKQSIEQERKELISLKKGLDSLRNDELAKNAKIKAKQEEIIREEEKKLKLELQEKRLEYNTQDYESKQEINQAEYRNRIESQKAYIRNNYEKYFVVDIGYLYRRIGGIENVKVFCYNKSDYQIAYLKVKIDYYRGWDGSLYKTEYVIFTNILPHQELFLYAPNSKRGTKAYCSIYSLNVPELNLNISN